jgi:adenosylcobinamide-GDP ribazoletransferase
MRSLRAYPLVGLAIGLGGALLLALAGMIDTPPSLVAWLILALVVLFTRGTAEMHLANFLQPIQTPVDHTRDLASPLSAAGVLVLILTIGLRVAALSAALSPEDAAAAWIAAATGARAIVPFIFGEFAAKAGQGWEPPSRSITLQALAIGVVVLVLCGGLLAGLSALFVGLGCSALTALWLLKKHDNNFREGVLGAVQMVAEIAIIMTIVIVA